MAPFFQGEKMAAGKYSHPMAVSGCLIPLGVVTSCNYP